MAIIDTATKKTVRYLRERALRCRRLAMSVDDPEAASSLVLMAEQCENEAKILSSQ